jgi:hypothetical protein
MKITNQRLQQLIRESIFKRIFGKKEKTRANIPDEIASDFGGGKETEIVDDFEIEDDSDKSILNKKIKRREALKYAAGLAAGGLALSQSNIRGITSGEFDSMCRVMFGEYYDFFVINVENQTAIWEDKDFKIDFRETDEYHGAGETDVPDWMLTLSHKIEEVPGFPLYQEMLNPDFLVPYENAKPEIEYYLRKLSNAGKL